LLSPWLDVSMENQDIDSIQDRDPILNREALKMIGHMYGQGLKLTDPTISPLYGKLIGIDSIALWIGTNDILYADALALEKRLKDEDIDFKVFKHQDMLHTWMFFGIKESIDAIREMVSYIKSLE
jgi:acetyl esterase/lipase